jgi:imidazolonepropionase
MGANIAARAISHLECISDDGISAMAKARTVAVILPHTGYVLRIELPPVRRMIDAGVIVALGTDANPNAFSSAMVTLFRCTNEQMTCSKFDLTYSLYR